MCGSGVHEFVEKTLSVEDVTGKSVLEVGALDVNGSVRPYLESLQPSRYVGVDLVPGPCVDEVCDVADLVQRFGRESFDLVVSTEMVEHVDDWRTAFEQMKLVSALALYSIIKRKRVRNVGRLTKLAYRAAWGAQRRLPPSIWNLVKRVLYP